MFCFLLEVVNAFFKHQMKNPAHGCESFCGAPVSMCTFLSFFSKAPALPKRQQIEDGFRRKWVKRQALFYCFATLGLLESHKDPLGPCAAHTTAQWLNTFFFLFVQASRGCHLLQRVAHKRVVRLLVSPLYSLGSQKVQKQPLASREQNRLAFGMPFIKSVSYIARSDLLLVGAIATRTRQCCS